MNNTQTDFSSLEKKLKLNFKDKNLLKKAFIHRSYLNENRDQKLTSNERLEFLGDTVLSFIMSSYLYNKFPEITEGDLTAIRSAVVKTKSLGEASMTLGLGTYLLLSKGEEDSGGKSNISLLANTFESLLGAIYLDQGLAKAQTFVKNNLLPILDAIIKEESFKDYKSKLQESIQEKLKISPNYELVSSSGPDHNKEFEIAVFVENQELGRGKGKSKQEAEQQAAKAALEKNIGV